MLTEHECWGRISKIVEGGIGVTKDYPSTAEVEKLNTYVNLILMIRRVEALEEG